MGGRLHDPMKGAPWAFEALSELMRADDTLNVAVCAPDDAEIDRFDLSVRARVHVHEWLSPEEVSDIMASCHVTLVPSLYEPFGMLALESLCVGTPVIGTLRGGLKSVVAVGQNGYLIDAAGSALLDVLTRRRQDLIRMDRREIQATAVSFDVSRIADRIIEVLLHAAEDHAS